MRFSAVVTLVATISSATMASAASLTISADQEYYSQGEPITLTLTGRIDPTVDFATNIYVRLELSGPLTLVDSAADTALNPMLAFGPQTTWLVGGTQGSLSGDSLTVFDQLQGLPPGAPFVNNFDGVDEAYVKATVVLMMDGEGPAGADFAADTNFFGIDPGPGWMYAIPEPTTAGLMGLGLVGLVIVGRRR